MSMLKIIRTGNSKNEKGFTLLEYCAGATVIAGVMYVGFNALGGSINTFLGSIGTWVNSHSSTFK